MRVGMQIAVRKSMKPSNVTHIREKIQAALLAGQPCIHAPEVFENLKDHGWEFQTPTMRTVPVVETPDGDMVVGEPDDRGIVWRAGIAFVTENGDEDFARANSVMFVPGCRVGTRTTSRFKVARVFGQHAILLAK